ncbi:hypothetical protein KKG65_01960 [Patescibacteria group bacterium]|nr:hypothetical protein [Patescibacteria group bacterium]
MEIKKIDLDQPTTSLPDQVLPKQKLGTAPLFIVLALILGVSSGAILKNLKSGSGLGGGSGVKAPGDSSTIKVGDVFGAKDESDFPDQAVGILEEGGMDGEGTHKLLRPGGVSQTAYLTSSVLDLDQFVGFKITVWAETFSAQKAGWLMDVGRVKVEELDPAPYEE